MNNAMGAVRATALGRRLAGSSRPKNCLQLSKGAFNRPATSIGREDFPCCPIKLGTVEHLIGAFPFHVVRQDDRQKSILSRLVVQGLDRLDRQGGMEPELVKLEFSPRSVWIVGPWLHAG